MYLTVLIFYLGLKHFPIAETTCSVQVSPPTAVVTSENHPINNTDSRAVPAATELQPVIPTATNTHNM